MSRIKIAGWQMGEFGDIVLASTLCRTIKELYPESDFTLCCHRKYANILPLFYNNQYVQGLHLWEGKIPDDWPAEKDLKFIETQDVVYTAKPQHKDNFWYLKTGARQITEIHNMYDFPEPKNKQCYLNPWFSKLSNCQKVITASVFPSGNHRDQLLRTFSVEQIIELFTTIEEFLGGYKIVRLDTRIEPELEDRWPASKLSIIDAAQLLYSSKLHLTTDTMFSWLCDAYSHPVVGWARLPAYVPVNPNGYYFINNTIQNIPIDLVIEKVKEKLKDL